MLLASTWRDHAGALQQDGAFPRGLSGALKESYGLAPVTKGPCFRASLELANPARSPGFSCWHHCHGSRRGSASQEVPAGLFPTARINKKGQSLPCPPCLQHAPWKGAPLGSALGTCPGDPAERSWAGALLRSISWGKSISQEEVCKEETCMRGTLPSKCCCHLPGSGIVAS